jgi:hypothetical protein
MDKSTGVTQPSSKTDTCNQTRGRNKTTDSPLLAATMVSYSELELACQIAASGPFHFTFSEECSTQTTSVATIVPDSFNHSTSTNVSDDMLDIDPYTLGFQPIGKRKSLVTRTHSPIEVSHADIASNS